MNKDTRGTATASCESASRPLRILWSAMTVSSGLYVLLCMHLPAALYGAAIYDDALFATHAASIAAGQWLGPFDFRTLLKGPGYPLFLALNVILGLPITLTQALLYSVACCLIGATLFRLTRSAWFTLPVFLAILWHPYVFPMRITRDDISPAQVLLLLACLLQFAFLARSRLGRLGWALTGGLVLGWFWLTREDAVWVMPGLALLLCGRFMQCWLQRRPLLPFALPLVVCFGAAYLVWCSIAAANWFAYGAFETVDFENRTFVRAVHELQMVRVGAPQPYVPVPAKVRNAIDAVSPAFAALEPYFDGPGQGWTTLGCAVDKSTCGDYAGGWFLFALRSAVASKGDYRSAQQAQAYYGDIADQVAAACTDGRLTCKPTLTALMPAVTPAQWHKLPEEIARIFRLLGSRDPLALPDQSTGDDAQLAAIEKTLNRPLRTLTADEQSLDTLGGWYYPKSDSWLQLRCTVFGEDRIVPVIRLPSLDVATFFKNPSLAYVRFTLTVPADWNCGLQSTIAALDAPVRSLAGMKLGPVILPEGELDFDSLQAVHNRNPGSRAQHLLLALRDLYKAVLPVTAVLAVLCFIWHVLTLLRQRRLGRFVVIAAALWLLVITRCVVLLLVDISSFVAISQNYMLPAFPLSCLAIGFSLALPFLRDDEPSLPEV